MSTNVVSSERDPLIALKQQASALDALAAALGISRSRLADKETLDRVADQQTVISTSAMAWDANTITKSLEEFGADSELILTTYGADSIFEMPEANLRGQTVRQSDIDNFMKRLKELNEEQGNDIYVDIRLDVKKTQAQVHLKQLLSQRTDFLGSAEIIAQTKVIICFYSETWHRLLTPKALWSWESRGLLSHGHRLVVALCDAEGYLGGNAIEVLGLQSSELTPELNLSRETWNDFLERGRAMRELCVQESNWGIGQLTITPEHFDLHNIQPGLNALVDSFDCMRAALSAAYMASSVQHDESEGHIVLQFAGTRPSHVLLPHNTEQPTIDGEFGKHALYDLAIWAYRHGSPDKLLIARECLARILPVRTSVDLAYVESQAGDTLDASESNFISYVRGSSAQYFQLRQQAVDAVTTYADDVEVSVSRLTSDLVSNVYKVAGLLAGAVAAVLIEPAVTVQVIVLSIIVQISFVIFNVCYALPAQERRYITKKAGIEKQLDVMTELTERERNRIRETAGGADADFEIAYRRARTIYFWMCGACIFIGLLAALILHGVSTSAYPVHGTATPTP